jgi:hypothetical protein
MLERGQVLVKLELFIVWGDNKEKKVCSCSMLMMKQHVSPKHQ